MSDFYSGQTLTGPAVRGEAVTPSDSTNLTRVSRAIWVGGAGNIAVVMQGGQTVTLASVPAGTLLPIRVSRVNATSTTATSIVALD